MFNELELVYYSNNRKEETDEFVETRLLSFKPTEGKRREWPLCFTWGTKIGQGHADTDITPISLSPHLLFSLPLPPNKKPLIVPSFSLSNSWFRFHSK